MRRCDSPARRRRRRHDRSACLPAARRDRRRAGRAARALMDAGGEFDESLRTLASRIGAMMVTGRGVMCERIERNG